MKIRTCRLSGTALDYVVAVIEKLPLRHDPMGFGRASPGGYWVWPDGFPPKTPYLQVGKGYAPSRLPQGDDIIDREKIETRYVITDSTEPNYWSASCLFTDVYSMPGATRREAAMRCFVASTLGDEVDVPEELL